ncbi:MAG: M14 family zinc carboxypeptidase [Bacteroidota bacterium]
MTTLRLLPKAYWLMVLLLGYNSIIAQVELIEDRFAFEPDLTYDQNIPSPADVLGYELGEKYTEYAATVDYMQKLAAASDKVTLADYGETYEGRTLIYLVITSADNQKNIEQIRQNNLKLADPTATTAEEAATIRQEQPVVVFLSYSIHGNEPSTTEATKQVAYRLAAATDAATAELLDNLVLVMLPCINPDGRSRYVSWYNSMERNVVGVEPKDLEHFAPWPNGRTNHYWFDLNRDWVWGVHPESRGHIKVYQDWMPQVHADYHEQGYNSNYFTMPGTTPRNKLLPDQYEALTDTFGMANIAAFDRHKIGYFTRESFDFYYPGYGSSYPSVMGAIGMLTEQGGIGGGRAIETSDGTILTGRQRIFDHYLTSIATLQKAAEHKDIFQKYTYDALNPKNSKDPTKAYILPNNEDDYVKEVIGVLLRQGVKVDQAEASFSATNVRNYRNGKSGTQTFPEGTYIVSCDQPRHLFINSIMSPSLAIEDSVMYDMSTWAAPLAYNVDAYQSNQALSVKTSPITKPPTYKKGVNNMGASYAYTIDWKQQYAPKALALLWQKKYRVRSAIKSFSDGKKEYSEGSLIILLGRNLDKAEQIEKDMVEIAEKANVLIDGHNTGRMTSGIDLVSNYTRPVKQPKVAMLIEPPFSTYTAGQLYFLFDQITALPVERIRTSMFQQTAVPKMGSRYGYANLHDYDVLLLPGGGSNLKQLFGKDQIQEIKNWVSAGGVLIGTESAAQFLTKKNSGLTNVELIKAPKDSTEIAKFLPFADRRDYRGKKNVPGAAMNAYLDTTNPLAFGMSDAVYSLKFGSDALKPSASFQTVGRYADSANLLASGYANSDNLKRMAGNAFAGVQPMGRGQVVFLLDNTQYRMFWRGPSRMMQNAVMLLGGM